MGGNAAALSSCMLQTDDVVQRSQPTHVGIANGSGENIGKCPRFFNVYIVCYPQKTPQNDKRRLTGLTWLPCMMLPIGPSANLSSSSSSLSSLLLMNP